MTRWSDGGHIWRDAYAFGERERRRFDLGEITGPMRLRLGFLPDEKDDFHSELRVWVGGERIASLAHRSGVDWNDRLIAIPAPEKGADRVIVEIDSGGHSRLFVSDLEMYSTQDAQRPPNVLTILVDTLRKDHVGCFGYARDTTPHIDRLAGESAKFSHMISQAPWTSPSVASIFSGYYPELHGVVNWRPTYLDGLPTITEALAQSGYATLGVTTNGLTRPNLGFDRGFQHFRVLYNLKEGGRDENAVDVAIREIGGVLGRPWFAHLHLFGPHSPYDPPEEFWGRYQDAGKLIDREELGRIVQNSNSTGMGWLFKHLCAWKRSDWQPVPGDTRADITSFLTESELKELAIALYDAEIRYTDEHIGRLLDFLREKGEYENTLILLVSDHGEEHWDHGEVHHGNTLHNESVSVPFIVKPPGRGIAPLVVDDMVELVDVAPTIADYTGIDLGWDAQGQSVRPAVEGRPITPRIARSSLTVYGFLGAADSRLVKLYLRSVEDQSRKVMLDESSGRMRFYDLVADPFERHPFYEAPDGFGPLIQTLEDMPRTDTQGLNILFCAPRDRATSLKGTVVIAHSGQAAFQSSFVQGRIAQNAKGWEFEIDARPSKEHHPESPRFNAVFFIPCPSDQSTRITLSLDGEPIDAEYLHLHRQTGVAESADITFSLNRHMGRLREYVGAAIHDRPSVYVWYGFDHMAAVSESLDSELDEELKALGYL